MTAPNPVGFLDFFILEASDYVEQLDALLLAGGESGPDADSLQRTARALRGSATMAKLTSFSEMAAGVERVGRALREGTLQWDPALRGVVVATVDDCKLLLRNVRSWSDADETRARARISELTSYAAVRGPTPMAAPTMQGHDSYLATETSNIGAGLELLATRPSDRDAATNVLRRVRALRGIASVKDHVALADVLEAAELALHPLEMGAPTLSAERVELLRSAATVLRNVATAIRTGTPSDEQSADIAQFAATLDAMQEGETGSERVVPISELFYDDGGATVVDESATPPTTPAQRFRLEAVSQGEHLRRLLSDARGANGELARERVRRGLRQALRSLDEAAESFGEHDVAEFIASHREAADRLDARALSSLDELATLLAQPGAAPAPIGERLSALKTARASMQTPAATLSPRPMMTPVIASQAIAPPTLEPQERVRPAAQRVAEAATVAASPLARQNDLLDAGIDKLAALGRAPLSAPAAIAEQPTVPINVLLYRGRAAILRCVEIRDEARLGGKAVEGDALNELFDLLDLALTN
jgi:chemotaxis protein histidine kinase CheA